MPAKGVWNGRLIYWVQFPVPQFTEVEDKIIGSLTVKQFGVIFGGGVLIFLAFTLTKSVVVLIFAAVIFGLPTLGLAFARLNGRPMYNMIGNFVGFLTSAKVLVFHKEGSLVSDRERKDKTPPVAAAPNPDGTKAVSPKQRLREVNKMLEQNAQKEEELFKK